MDLENLLSFTRDVLLRDSQEPILWTDATLTLFLNEAETIFARKTHCLVSDSESFCTVTTTAGQAKYALSDKIIYLMNIVDSNGVPLRSRGRSKVPLQTAYGGKPVVFTADSAYKGIRLYPVPDDAYTYTLTVAHKPTAVLSGNDDVPEIPEEYHSFLPYYAAFKALVTNDPEGSNTVAAEPFKLEWELALRNAKRDAYHMRAGPNPTVVNSWTGGRR